MAARCGGILALLAFAVSVLAGGIYGGNSFTTTVTRGLLAMAVSFVIGLVIGLMAQRMLEENASDEKSEKTETRSQVDDR